MKLFLASSGLGAKWRGDLTPGEHRLLSYHAIMTGTLDKREQEEFNLINQNRSDRRPMGKSLPNAGQLRGVT